MQGWIKDSLYKATEKRTDFVKQYVWYASYGSNIEEERFLCYIQGGIPSGSTQPEKGCRDKSLPCDTRTVYLPYHLYFSGYSNRWGGGPAYIGHDYNEKCDTLGRMYKITEEQFIDVLKQENNLEEVSVNLRQVKESGFLNIEGLTPYGRIVYLGDKEGAPIFTFTCDKNMTERTLSKPSLNYLSTIASGIKQIYKMEEEEIIRYFSNKSGIKGMWREEELSGLMGDLVKQ